MSDGDSESGSSTDPTPESAPPDGYTVGYRNPPKEFRFKPGNNANPRGRPKGSRKENVIVKELFLERLPVRDGDGKKSMSKLEIILTKLLNRAISRFDRYRTSQWASLCEYPICLLAVDAKWVRTAPIRGAAGRAEETLLIEWPRGEPEPTKYWLSTLDEKISFRRLVDLAKMRWRIERDYQELKQQLGLGHYEGRGWPGFHHHGTLCVAAYGFLISEKGTIPPSGPGSSRKFTKPAVPSGYRPRGAPDPARTTHSQLDRHPSSQTDRCDSPDAPTLPMLCTPLHAEHTPCSVTQ